jgi:hypothetical protein
MAVNRPVRGKKYFTAAEANAMLPLVRAIVGDITELARNLQERHDRLARVRRHEHLSMTEAYQEELRQVQAEFERDQERMREFEHELKGLGIELKDYHTGLIDFPSWMDNREVYLCWRLGEPEVGHWHELDAGFAGRQRLQTTDPRSAGPRIQTSGL